jgi:hypothetical protein
VNTSPIPIAAQIEAHRFEVRKLRFIGISLSTEPTFVRHGVANQLPIAD